jgi:Flp pilus assembly protein TadG
MGRWLAHMLDRLRRDEGGSTAIEYAFIAPAYIALLLGVLHIALIYLAQEGLETAVESSARLIMTGQAQTTVITNGTNPSYTGMTASDFRTAVCSGIAGKDVSGTAVNFPSALPPFLTCSRLAVNVQVAPVGCSSPTVVTPTFTVTNGTISSAGSGFGAADCAGTNKKTTGLYGTQGQLVIVQLAYLWPTVSAPLGLNFVNQAGGNRLLVATYVLTIENYICSSGTTTTC